MSDPTDEGPPEPGPLTDTFPEFVRYARNRRKKGPRQAPATPPGRVLSETTVRQAAFAAGTVVSFFLLLGLGRWVVGPAAGPHQEVVTRGRVSGWIDLPRPRVMGEVPDGWGALKLGIRKQDVPGKPVPYSGKDQFADLVYAPDPAQPDVWMGLSFHKERLYRIAVRYGEDSPFPSQTYVAAAAIAYGKARGYEYPTVSARHVVTIYQSETRALKIDSAKAGEVLNISEVVLVDLEQGAARELARARGTK